MASKRAAELTRYEVAWNRSCLGDGHPYFFECDGLSVLLQYEAKAAIGEGGSLRLNLRKPTILIADDHPRIRDSVKRLLAPHFRVVGAVPDGAALIAAAKELKPDVVVTDLVMKPINGLEAASVLLAEWEPRPLIILLTGVADSEVVAEALRIGIRAYVAKPRLSEDLIPAIHSVLAGSQFTSVPFTEMGRTRSRILTYRSSLLN